MHPSWLGLPFHSLLLLAPLATPILMGTLYVDMAHCPCRKLFAAFIVRPFPRRRCERRSWLRMPWLPLWVCWPSRCHATQRWMSGMRRWCSWPSRFSSRKGCCCCSGSAARGPLQHAAAAAPFQAALPMQRHLAGIRWSHSHNLMEMCSTETAGAAQHTGAQHSSAPAALRLTDVLLVRNCSSPVLAAHI